MIHSFTSRHYSEPMGIAIICHCHFRVQWQHEMEGCQLCKHATRHLHILTQKFRRYENVHGLIRTSLFVLHNTSSTWARTKMIWQARIFIVYFISAGVNNMNTARMGEYFWMDKLSSLFLDPLTKVSERSAADKQVQLSRCMSSHGGQLLCCYTRR